MSNVISDFCKKGEHEWCANRNYEECHCECSCHEEKAEAARSTRLAPVIEKLRESRDQQKAALERVRKQIRDNEESDDSDRDYRYAELVGEKVGLETGLYQFNIALREIKKLDLPGWIGAS